MMQGSAPRSGRVLNVRPPQVGVDATAVLEFLSATVAGWPMPVTSTLALLVAMVGNDETPVRAPDGSVRFGVDVELLAPQLGLSLERVRQTLWILMHRVGVLGLDHGRVGSSYTLSARYAAVHEIAGRVDWPLVLGNLSGKPRPALAIAVLRQMLGAYPVGTTVDSLLELHPAPVAQAALAAHLHADAADVRSAQRVLQQAGLWDSPRQRGHASSWRWHPQMFGLAPFSGDRRLPSADEVFETETVSQADAPRVSEVAVPSRMAEYVFPAGTVRIPADATPEEIKRLLAPFL